MLRTLLSPRLVGLHLVTVAVLISFAFLGRWQLGVFEESGRPHVVSDPAPVALTTLVPPGTRMPGEDVGRRVTAQGAFDAARQLLVAERAPTVEAGGGEVTGGDSGYWLLTPLALSDGTVMPVVRGWVPTAGDPATAVPEGTVTVTGRVQPPEPTDFARRRTAPLPAGQVATVSTSELVNLWRGLRLRDGFIVATGLSPAAQAAGKPESAGAGPIAAPPTPAGSGLRPVAVPPPTESGAFTWRNLAYAAQWWIFAGFAVFMWFHFVRDAVRASRTARTGDRDSGDEPGEDPDRGSERDADTAGPATPAAAVAQGGGSGARD
ncbi:SURF1-like protein [Sphaerisporangium melleum]|uniref:SURF1-like protein n=1 Tax=Sphaerisporangium melleum TaxID=321316 RepID=A0A917VPM6_9ACTN|nr:SURF1 family protein [Sphaerisporangium melleum]GGL05431.1 SURF1-like protein [Sphaerisporangium melleum]GII73887.1 SURF1-like protein [Sphaerisporangium melleum]